MAKSAGILATAAIVSLTMFLMLVTVTARVVPIHPYLKLEDRPISQLYDTSNYGFLQIDNGLARTPQMGWSTWNFFACNINETVIKETADALISTGLASLGYTYVNIDDCWSRLTRNLKGEMIPDPETFPSGIKALADYVHSKGLKLGVYSDAGAFTCQVRPGSLFHEKNDAELWASWGVDYLKYDNCFNLGLPPQKRYPPMRDALNATGRSIFYALCEWGIDDPALWAGQIGNSWRTTDDINDTWTSMTTIADINNKWASYLGPGGWNDPDMLEVGNGGMNYNEYKGHFSIWALMKATHNHIFCQLLHFTDPLGVRGRKVYASDRMSLRGLTLLCSTNLLLLLFLILYSGLGRSIVRTTFVVVLRNRCSKAATITAKWGAIGLQPSITVYVRDLWKSTVGSFSARVDAHGREMYILTPRERNRSSI
ncbi:unnamed protein product [Withania somnifera]